MRESRRLLRRGRKAAAGADCESGVWNKYSPGTRCPWGCRGSFAHQPGAAGGNYRDGDGRHHYARRRAADLVFNAAAEKIFGCPAADAIGYPLDRFLPAQYREAHRNHVHRFGNTGETSRSMYSPGTLMGLRANGEEFPLDATISQATIAGEKLYTVILRDITQRKQAEQERETTVEFLHLVNESTGTRDLIGRPRLSFSGNRVVRRSASGCGRRRLSVFRGTRVPQGICPCREQPMRQERSGRGNPRYRAGDPAMDCMCGNVICGRFDASQTFFTEGGSFWVNSTTRLLATTAEADRQARTRNRCNGEGYESVALMPF